MKVSNYNYIIHKNSYSYWYNGINHTFFKVPISLGKKLEHIMNDNINMLPTNFCSRLVEKGFIVSDNTKELDIIREKYNEQVCRKDYLLTIQIEWFGGEPFLYFKQVILPICEYAQKLCAQKQIPYSTTATTNGYYLLPKICPDLVTLGFKRFQITLDGPKEQHDKVKFQNNCPSAFTHVLNNIEYILSNSSSIEILLRINYTEENLDQIIVEEVNQIISPQNRCKVRVMPKKVWQENVRKSRYESVKTILQKFHASGYNTVHFDAVNTFIPCYANRKYYNAINYNGDVVKCTASNDLYEKCTHGEIEPDGSIKWNHDFIKKYKMVFFENKRCLQCKYLPLCMGVCPRDNYTKACKLENVDFHIEDSLVNYIDTIYETKSVK